MSLTVLYIGSKKTPKDLHRIAPDCTVLEIGFPIFQLDEGYSTNPSFILNLISTYV
jgi:hypothetical protein